MGARLKKAAAAEQWHKSPNGKEQRFGERASFSPASPVGWVLFLLLLLAFGRQKPALKQQIKPRQDMPHLQTRM